MPIVKTNRKKKPKKKRQPNAMCYAIFVRKERKNLRNNLGQKLLTFKM